MLGTHACFISFIALPDRLLQEIPDADHRNVKIPDAVYDVEFPLDQE